MFKTKRVRKFFVNCYVCGELTFSLTWQRLLNNSLLLTIQFAVWIHMIEDHEKKLYYHSIYIGHILYLTYFESKRDLHVILVNSQTV